MSVNIMRNNGNAQIMQHGERARSRREALKAQDGGRKPGKGVINLSGQGNGPDAVLMRKQLARKKAMKVVSDAWAGDKKIDAGLEESRAHIDELRADMSENTAVIKDYMTRKEALKEEYGITDDSAAAEEGLPEEYKQRVSELDAIIDVYQGKVDEAQGGIMGEVASIRSTRIERLKTHVMEDAQKEADAINEAASKEVIGMLINESKDYVDKKLEEEQEAAKEKAEEKEEQEEKLEEQKLEKEKLQVQLDIKREESKGAEEAKAERQQAAREQSELLEDAEANYTGPNALPSEAQAEIKELLQKLKLLDEDLKGAKVDNKL